LSETEVVIRYLRVIQISLVATETRDHEGRGEDSRVIMDS